MNADLPEKNVRRLNDCLMRSGLPQVSLMEPQWVLDEQVAYKPFDFTAEVSGANLFSTAELETRLASRLAGGPSWIHANLIRTADKQPLITIRVGQLVGNENPTLNVSCEPNWTAVVRYAEPSTA